MSSSDTNADQHLEITVDSQSNVDQQGLDISASPLVIGWREWVSLPDIGLPAVKAKVDTGARTSAIHASEIKRFKYKDGSDWVAFTVMPIQRVSSIVRRCEAPLVDIRKVTDSGGHSEERYFITTNVVIGDLVRSVEITLAQRTDMLFRMLLGRTSMIPGIVVNPQLSYTLGRLKARAIYKKIASGVDS
ncbi:MAG: ATP-dependent zinc protease [Granulosicoccus sp.]